MLGFSLHGWENAMVVALIVAGLFALVAGVATWAVVTLQRVEIAKSTRELEEYKAEARRRIAQANAAGDAARAEAAKANKSAEDERLARIQLEAKLTPRRLDAAQQQAIAHSMMAFAGKKVRLESYGLDAESAVLAFQIRESLRTAQMNVDDTGLMTRASGGSIALGVHVTGKDTDLTNAVLVALTAAHIVSSPDEPFPQGGVCFGPMMPATPPDAVVFVGIKPIAE